MLFRSVWTGVIAATMLIGVYVQWICFPEAVRDTSGLQRGRERPLLADTREVTALADLVRLREAKEWISRGGIILRIRRPGVDPATEWERTRLQELYDGGAIHDTIINDSTLDVLWDRVGRFAAFRDPYLQTR